MSSKPWWIAQLAIGMLVAAVAIVSRVVPASNNGTWANLGYTPATAELRFIFPVFALSLLVNAMLMAGRSNPFMAAGEATLLLIQFIGIPASIALCFVQDAIPSSWIPGLFWGPLIFGLLLLGFVVAVVEIANWRAPTRPPVRRV